MKNLAKIFLPLLALSLLFGAGCSSDSEGSSAPEYCGNYTSTQEFTNYIISTLDGNENKDLISDAIEEKGILLTINDNGKATLMMMVPVSYTAEGNAITFREFNATEESIQAIANGFNNMLNVPFTYANGTLSAAFDGKSMECFKKS